MFAIAAASDMLATMNISWPSRRWFRFSLRGLLLFVTLYSLACSWVAVRLRDEKREEAAAAAIEALGAQVEWDKNAAGPTWLRGVLGEHFFGHVEGVTFVLDEVTEKSVKSLVALPHLQSIGIFFTNVSDAGLKRLQRLHGIKNLSFIGTNVTNAGLDKLAGLKQFETLQLWGTEVTDAGLDKLAVFEKLQELSIDGENITDVGLEHLQRMKQLTSLTLADTKVTAAGVQKLQHALPNCKFDFASRHWTSSSIHRPSTAPASMF
jgi:hypothetical protein